MCGIAAILRTQGATAPSDDLATMLSMIRYRGPDEAGVAHTFDGRLGLGQVRLSIVDLAAGRQPMWDTRGELCIIFNGEIYDHQALRADLEGRGITFRTRTDTEVILGLYRAYGMDFFAHLNGEFAFMLWDHRVRRLLVCRDRHGIKPLFFHRTDDATYFCSEAKGILALPQITRRLNPAYLTGAMFGAWPDNTHAFLGIEQISPGHVVLFDNGERQPSRPYWTPTYQTDTKMTFDDAKEGVREHLRRAVKRRLVADVPVCMYLSGGIDSTLVAKTAAELGQPMRSFTLGFTGSVFDETERARKTAAFLGLPFEEVPCSERLLAQNIGQALFHTETCIGNAGPIGKMVLSRHVRAAGFKVALTGEGADELFAGYPYFKLELIQQMMLGSPQQRREAEALWARFKVIEHRSEGLLWNRRSAWRTTPMVYGYPSFLHVRATEFAALIPRLLTQEVRAQALPPDQQFVANFPPADLRGMHPTLASLRMTLNWLSGYILINFADRLEMANSIEGRPAFLDHEMARFASSVPPAYLTHLPELREKYVLHQSYIQAIPDEVRNTHKHPFVSPSWRTLAKTPEGKEIFADALSPAAVRAAGIFAPESLARLKLLWRLLPPGTNAAKRLDTLMGLALSAQLLHRMFVAERPAPVALMPVQQVQPPAQ